MLQAVCELYRVSHGVPQWLLIDMVYYEGLQSSLAYTQYVLLECYTDQVLLTVTSKGAGDGMTS